MLKRILHIAWLLSVATLLLTAVCLMAVRLWVPSLADYRLEVERAASEVLDRQVTVGRMDATWRGLHPVLKLQDVTVATSNATLQPFRAEEIWVRLNVIPLLRDRRVEISGIEIIGTDITLVRDRDGRIYMEGFSGDSGGDTAGLAAMTRLALHESTITFRDDLGGDPPQRFSGVMLSLTNRGDDHRIAGHAMLPGNAGYRVELDARFNGEGMDFRKWQGRAYLTGQLLALPVILQRLFPGTQPPEGVADLRLWVDVDAARVTAVTGELDVHDFRMKLDQDSDAAVFAADSIRAQLGWRVADNGWQAAIRLLSVRQDDWQWAPLDLSFAGGRAGSVEYLGGFATRLGLEDLRRLLPAIPGSGNDRLHQIAALEPTGQFSDLDFLLLRRDGAIRLSGFSARFSDIGIRQSGAFPTVDGLDGSISGVPGSGTLSLDGVDVAVADTRLFRDILSINHLQGDVSWMRDDGHVRIMSEKLALKNADMSLSAKFAVNVPETGSGTTLDLDMMVESVDIGRLSHYLPAKIMRERGIAWLDHSLVEGHISRGSVRINGRLDQIPFDHGEGVLEVRLPVRNVTLDFNDNWSPLTRLDAQVDFTGRQMDITSQQGNIRTVSLQQVHAQIKDLAKPYLTLKGMVQGPLPVMLAELGSSPLGEAYGGFVDRTETTGATVLQLDIQVPLTGKDRSITVAGNIDLKGNTLSIRDSGIALTGIRGELAFDDGGIRGDDLQATLFERTASVRVWSETDKPYTHIQLDGRLGLLDAVLDEQHPWRDLISGDSDWQVEVTVRGKPARGKAADVGLRVSSSLAGTEVDLPAPFYKSRESTRALTVVIDNTEKADRQVELTWGDNLKGALLVRTGAGEAVVHSGMLVTGSAEATLPDRPGLLLAGHLNALSFSDWQAFLDKVDTGFTIPLRFDLEIDELEIMDYILPDIGLVAESTGRVWRITASGPSTSGVVELTQSADGLEKIVMNMKRLTLQPASETQPERSTTLTPANFPDLQINAGELVYNNASFGQLELKLVKQPGNKLLIERLALSSKLLSMSLNGEWGMTAGEHLSRVDLVVTGGQMGRLLDVLGYEKTIKKGDLYGSMSVSWPAPLWDFSPANMEGKLSVNIKKGQLLDVEPGAGGRVLGLLSLGKLPKRLTLDFTDLFGTGFGFNRIAGTFVLEGGNAYTNDLVIDGLAAKIDISGRVGLADQDYDELVTVTPSLESSLPLAGALAGGPVVGAAVIVAGKLLEGKLGLNKIARKQYAVTGPWDAPDVVRINVPAVKAADVEDPVEQDFE